MRLLVYSDIHANQAALGDLTRAVANTPTMQADATYCIGDVVGYGGWPTESWRWVANNFNNYENLRLGNHDVTAARWIEAGALGMRRDGIFSIALHRAMLRKEDPHLLADLEWLGGAPNSQPTADAINANIEKYQLPLAISSGVYRVVMVHADMCDDSNPDICSARGTYLSAATKDHGKLSRAARLAFENYPPPPNGLLIVVVGHSHRPMITVVDTLDRIYVEGADYSTSDYDAPFDLVAWAHRMNEQHGLTIDNIKAIIVNPGSVGSSRDGLGMQNDATVGAHALHLDLEQHQLRFFVQRYNAQRQSMRLGALDLASYFEEQDWRDLHQNLAGIYAETCHNNQSTEKLIDEVALQQLNINQLYTMPNGIQTYDDLCRFLRQSYRDVAADARIVYERIWQVAMRQYLDERLTNPMPNVANGDYGYLYTRQGFKPHAP